MHINDSCAPVAGLKHYGVFFWCMTGIAAGAQVKEYMSVRPRSQQSALRPFMAAEGEGGVPAQSDSGGASFLGQASILFAFMDHRRALCWNLHLPGSHRPLRCPGMPCRSRPIRPHGWQHRSLHATCCKAHPNSYPSSCYTAAGVPDLCSLGSSGLISASSVVPQRM